MTVTTHDVTTHHISGNCLENTKNALLINLREDLLKSEAETKEALAREQARCTELNDAKKEIEYLQQKVKEEVKKREEQENDRKRREESQERVRLSTTSELQENQSKLEKSAAHLEEACRKRQIAEENLEKLEIALARKSSLVKELEEKLDEMVARVRESDTWKQKYEDQIATLEKANLDLCVTRDKSRNELVVEQKRTFELEQNLREMNNAVKSAERKFQCERECRNEREEKMRFLLNKIRQLETQLDDRSVKSDLNVVLSKNSESEKQSIIQKLNKQKQTNAELTRQNEEMSASLQAVEKELATTKAMLEKKKITSKQAMEDLLSNYKHSEKRFMECEAECEQMRAYIRATKSKLDELEKHRAFMETQNADLAKKLEQYEKTGFPTPLQQGYTIIDASKAPSSGLGDSRSLLCTTVSSHGRSSRGSSEKIVQSHDLGYDNSLDINPTTENTLLFFRDRVEQLERDKAELSSNLVLQREELKGSIVKAKEAGSQIERAFNVITSSILASFPLQIAALSINIFLGLGDSRSLLCTTVQSHDLGYDNSLDINPSTENTLLFFRDRVEQLERDKAELSSNLVLQREELKGSIVKAKEASDTVQSLENQLMALQSGRRCVKFVL
ncbi:hypothetical protein DICVIV_02588 [Dictyocaulus viviparus]|uniref:M protein repeat protein n=1 Tax=Dictyocaulus viviparus TaxID=29172 RepID=A0A0D8Y303_DICVI|nr:hypothetical protein DICVIV_02588 [Dictyocaulus viviparus]